MYVRRGVNCELVDQPNHEIRQDVYGNSFENWCVDFVRTDEFNFPIAQATGCSNQDPDNLLPEYIFNTSDNGTRVPELYIKSPLIPGTTVDEAIKLDTFGVLGLEQDRDLVLYNSNNTQSLRLEDDTTVLTGTVFS